MWKLRSFFSFFSFLLLCYSAAAQRSRTPPPSKWQTLSGSEPLVIARGGFSGIFPDSSLFAYSLAVQTSLPNVHLWCDVQLTKDGAGICFPDVKLENSSNIDAVNAYRNRKSTYAINGVPTEGWFSVDFTLKELGILNLIQRIFSRAPNFDNIQNQIFTVETLASQINPLPGLWLNIPHDAFFSQHNLSMRSYVLSVSRRVIVNYISSPEVGFLRSIASRFRTGPTKLVFQFLKSDDVEPTTNQTYGSLLSNLTLIKTFASGILIPKNYIWPAENLYLKDSTTVVLDAHAAGLEVFASNFANDAALPYNYSYDPVTEYLSYIDNGKFSVDGVLSDFPITPSESIDCFAHASKNDSVHANVLVISNEGASGDYTGCTDKAYEKAVSDGVDILDCPVQMTNDGIPFCLGTINIRDRTNVAETEFSNRATDNADLGITDGVFAYNLTWTDIQSLKPAIFSPYPNFSLYRNPKSGNEGSFMQLSDFLAFAKNASSVSGVLISIENAAYLAEKQGLGVTDAVFDALSKAGYNETTKKVMIMSSDSAVLSKFKSSSNYELVYVVDEDVSGILNSTITTIKKFASSVVVSKKSVFPTDKAFLTGETSIVPTLQAFNLSVYVQHFRNEYPSQAWDFFSDPYVEINTFVSSMGINGVITDFPATASKYKRNRCLGYKEVPIYMSPVQPASLLSIMPAQDLPPAEAPNPVLTESGVVEPPLPAVIERPPSENAGNGSTAQGPTPPNGQPRLVGSTIFGGIAILLAAFVM